MNITFNIRVEFIAACIIRWPAIQQFKFGEIMITMTHRRRDRSRGRCTCRHTRKWTRGLQGDSHSVHHRSRKCHQQGNQWGWTGPWSWSPLSQRPRQTRGSCRRRRGSWRSRGRHRRMCILIQLRKEYRRCRHSCLWCCPRVCLFMEAKLI